MWLRNLLPRRLLKDVKLQDVKDEKLQWQLSRIRAATAQRPVPGNKGYSFVQEGKAQGSFYLWGHGSASKACCLLLWSQFSCLMLGACSQKTAWKQGASVSACLKGMPVILKVMPDKCSGGVAEHHDCRLKKHKSKDKHLQQRKSIHTKAL